VGQAGVRSKKLLNKTPTPLATLTTLTTFTALDQTHRMKHTCPLCQSSAVTDVIYNDAELRIIWANEPGYPCFIRVVWNAHVAEMSDLTPAQRYRLIDVVCEVETVLRAALADEQLAKINLASFGNWVPHLHWHVIPRYTDDAHWPNSPFAAPSREGVEHGADLKPAIAQAIKSCIRPPKSPGNPR
jgi:diadenosine tetraphosphate (Ap4A) HIT family hydrolase